MSLRHGGDKRVIVNADDLGLARSVNEAIFAAVRAGNVTSATLMVNMPAAEHAAVSVAEHPGLAVGLHFNITEGRALSGQSSLTDVGDSFASRGTLLKRALRRRIDPADVRQEFEAQLAKAADLGIALTHTDSHQHAMMLPVIFDAVAPVLAARRLPVRIVRPPRRAVTAAGRRPRKFLKQLANAALAARHSRRPGVLANDTLVSVHDLDSAGPYSAQTYLDLLAGADGGAVELMVHPYVVGEDVREMYGGAMHEKEPFLQRCTAEFEVLRGPAIFDGHQLITFADL